MRNFSDIVFRLQRKMKKVSGAELIEEARGKRFFNCPEASVQAQYENARDFKKKFPDKFRSTVQARRYLGSIITPASLRWSFLKNEKTATTSAIHFLFRQEFNTSLNASWGGYADANTDAAGHNLNEAAIGIFRPHSRLDHSWNILKATLRLTTARHPVARAVSSFSYISKTQALESPYFAMDRALMCVLVQFDWEKDAYTAKGFEKFLNYIEIVQNECGPEQVNVHWLPQYLNVLPEVFKPDIIGRTENMKAFYKEVAERLGNSPPKEEDLLPRNSQSYKADKSELLTPDVLRRIEKIYAMDFEWLGEDPHHF